MSCCDSESQFSKDIKARESFEKRWNLSLRDTAFFKDFELIRTIGIGAFGRVYCVRHHQNKKYYAMKVLKKEKIVRMEQVERVFNEKRILQSIVNPFLVDLRFVFKTNSNLFFVMPFIRGGEIYSYLKSLEKFSESQTKFYTAQIILAFQYLHSMKIIYRDLKPENILLECDGYIKITDFGFAKRLEKGVTSSFVGTPEYMAPEMLIRTKRAEGYGCSVDWWTLGVFMYECACGQPPFSGISLLQVFDSIVKRRFSYPDHLSDPLVDLLDGILQNEIDARLGCKGKGAEELKSHEFYKELNWLTILEKKIPAEFVPNCEGEDFTKNFESFKESTIEENSTAEFRDVFKGF